MASARPHNRAGSRQASGSGGVIGLPGTIDLDLLWDNYDPNQFDPAMGNPDDIFGVDQFDFSTLNLPLEGFDMNHFLASEDFPQQAQGDRGLSLSPIQTIQVDGRGLSLSPIHSIQIGHPGQTVAPKGEAEDVNGPFDIPVEPFGNPPLDPALDLWDPNMLMQAPFVNVTPGFSAIPQGTDFAQSKVPAQPAQVYPDPYAALYPTGPYFTQPHTFTGYVPMPAEQPVASGPVIESWQKATLSSVQRPQKRKHDRSDSISDDDAPIVKRMRPVQQKHTPPAASSRRPSTSDGSSITKPVKTAVIKPGQKPKKVEDKTWVRVNTSTRGETTRTARINQYTEEGSKYKMKALPRGDWESTNYKFEYMQIGRMHEFKKRTMSARQIHEYITEHPGDLRIWIQPVASDSARRYFSATQNHCRFEKCPMRKYTGKGTTEVGNYRVAFDEKHLVYGTGVADPYDCVGYAHLYCMERFLDFAYICQVANVKVDQRVSLEAEPKGVFAAAFGHKHQPEIAVAKTFIDACRKGRLSETRDFADYPVHEDYEKGASKPHNLTLVYALYEMNLEHRAPSQMKQFVSQREIRPGSFTIHRGDIEVKLVHKKIEMLEAYKDWKRDGGSKQNFNYSDYYDAFHPEINVRIREMLARRDQMAKDDAANGPTRGRKRHAAPVTEAEHEAPTPKRPKRTQKQVIAVDSSSSSSSDEAPPRKRSSAKGKRYERDSSSSEEEESEYEEIVAPVQPQHQHGTRYMPRRTPRIDYTEPQDFPAQPSPPPPVFAPHEQLPLDTRRFSATGLFPTNDTDWENFDFENMSVPLGDTPLLTQAQVDALIAMQRRQSSTLSIGPCAWRKPRTASFNKQPVSSSTKFRRNDPPSKVKSAAETKETVQQTRWSKRLATQAVSPK